MITKPGIQSGSSKETRDGGDVKIRVSDVYPVTFATTLGSQALVLPASNNPILQKRNWQVNYKGLEVLT